MKYIPIQTHGKFVDVATVDDEDFDRLMDMAPRCWNRHSMGYAWADGVLMHRAVLHDLDPLLVVDHINGDKLDNRKANLRACDQRVNQRNRHRPAWGSSGFTGISYCKAGTWVAHITAGGKFIRRSFREFEDALWCRLDMEEQAERALCMN